MRLRTSLLHVAALLTAGCGGEAKITGASDAGAEDALSPLLDAAAPDAFSPDASSPALDAGPDVVVSCGGCGCGSQPTPSGNVPPAQACTIAHEITTGGFGDEACISFCDSIGGQGDGFCTLAPDYMTAYFAAVDDAGASTDAGADADAGLLCPTWTSDVLVECGAQCLGRRTEGLCELGPSPAPSLGAVFAERAYLEEVSVHAFARLERELAAHGAPSTLLRAARRARRDEVRHTATMTRLARRYGGVPRSPVAPLLPPVRPLLEIALENAVEGCVRETYGAVIALVEARASSDPVVRQAMERIGTDECRHAELAWSVASWLLPRLTDAERAAVEDAVADAIASLAEEGDARAVELLARHVWAPAA